MATKKNPANEGVAGSVFAAHLVGLQRFVFDLSAGYASGANADETLILIGYVPADCVMVRHLSRLQMPQMDTNGAPTGDHEVGTADDPDALLASIASETAATVYSGEDFRTDSATAVIGSQTEDTPIYVRLSNAIATLSTGTIVFDLAYRAFNSRTDA